MIVRTKPIDAFQANRGVAEGRTFGAAGDDANGLSHSRTLDYRLGLQIVLGLDVRRHISE